MLKVNVFNESGISYLPKKKTGFLVERTLIDEGICSGEINVVLLNDPDIQEINVRFLDHNYPTDVISFKLEDKPLLAEIYIGADVAVHQAKEYGVSRSNEIARLAVHGSLHIAGYDDATDDEKKNMRNLENKYLDLYYV
jgi:probable rRNA maturation factor